MRTDTVFSTSSLQAYLSLVFLCGVALAFSIQPAVAISAIRMSDMRYPPGLFHMSFILIFGLFSINRGSLIAANITARIARAKLVLRFAEHIAYALVLLTPYFLYSRSLMPRGVFSLVVLILYSAVMSLFFCLLSLRLEQRGGHRKQSAFLLRYGTFLAFCLIPFGIGLSVSSLSAFVNVSPVGFASRMIAGASAFDIAIGFLVPIAGIFWLLTRRQRFDRRHHAV